MTLEEIKAWLEANKGNSDVQAYLGELSTPTVEGVEGFLDTPEGLKVLQPRLDANFTKGLNTWKEKNLDKLVDEEVRKRNPAKTPEQIELENLRQELENQRNEAKREKLMNAAMKQATEKGLPTSILQFLLGEDEESTLKNLSLFETDFEAAKQKAVDEKFKAGGREIPGGTPPKDDSVGATFAKGANEQAKPIESNLWG